ncbi:MAG: mismatch endonuclease, patch repair protein [Solirubrobacteraceae bacterium]|nr:mismatch endonuclease, patch repair protein [Solirubrobacteraceae bacterium]
MVLRHRKSEQVLAPIASATRVVRVARRARNPSDRRTLTRVGTCDNCHRLIHSRRRRGSNGRSSSCSCKRRTIREPALRTGWAGVSRPVHASGSAALSTLPRGLAHSLAMPVPGQAPVPAPDSPPPTSAGRSRNMAAIRRRDTGPERSVRSLLHRAGFRFRVDLPIRIGSHRPVRPDIVFPRARLAVFIDGCWWHGCPQHGRRPHVRNGHYWGPKIAGNMERDRRHTQLLESAGWTVRRYWEHEGSEEIAAQVAREFGRLTERQHGQAAT